jgi:hypothetical protein
MLLIGMNDHIMILEQNLNIKITYIYKNDIV